MSTRWIIIFLSIVCLGTGIAAVVLYSRYRSAYGTIQQIQLDPLSLGAFDDTPAFSSDSSLFKVLFWGDSRAYAWPVPDQMLEFEFANRGIPGHTTAQCLGRYEQHVVSLTPDIMVVQMGINDLKTLPLFPKQSQQIIEQCISQIQQQILQSREQGIMVVLTSIFPTGDVPLARRAVWSSEIDDAVIKVNERLIQWAEADPGIVILETAPILAGEDGQVLSEYQRDLLHLNAAGYAQLNRALREVLRGMKKDYERNSSSP